MAVLILAHGAGAGMSHPFMANLAEGIAGKAIHVLRFNFPYMDQGRKSPGSPKVNVATWKEVVNHVQAMYTGLPVFVGGKSYGGRMASHLLAEEKLSVNGILYFGFPLHAPGKDSTDRAGHLSGIQVPQLFLQGRKDKLANPTLLKEVIDPLPQAELIFFEHADHSFHVPKKSGKNDEEVMEDLIAASSEWMNAHL